MAQEKLVIDGLEGFRRLAGQEIGTSQPLEITQERIEQFCRATDNYEWTHWDVERCKASPWGNTIAPSFLAPGLFASQLFQMVEIVNVNTMLFQGSDRIRLISPLVCGSRLTQTIRIDRVEERDKGIAVYYDVTWNVQGKEKPIAVAMFIIRYMD